MNINFKLLLHTTTILLSSLVISATSTNVTTSDDIISSMHEMQRASYFTFVTLLNMVKDKLPHNTTFLMPSDRALSRAYIPENQTINFVLRHSIPSPLSFEDLLRLPNGSLIPTNEDGFSVRVLNGGRRAFYLNNVEVVGANVCRYGTAFRCHGVFGVLKREDGVGGGTVTCGGVIGPGAGPGLGPIPGPGPAPAPSRLVGVVVGPPNLGPVAVVGSPSVDVGDAPTNSGFTDRIDKGRIGTVVLGFVLSVLKFLL